MEQQELIGDPSGNASSSYWDSWFTKVSAGEKFEWYCDTDDIAGLIERETDGGGDGRPYLLHVGTGNSEMVLDLSDRYPRAAAIDISSVAIEEMLEKVKLRNDGSDIDISFVKHDVLRPLASVFPDPFQGVVDKGLFDAMMSDSGAANQSMSFTMFRNLHGAMEKGAPYICVTLAEEHIVRLLLEVLLMRAEEEIADGGGGGAPFLWSSLSIHCLNPSGNASSLRPFAFVLRKASVASNADNAGGNAPPPSRPTVTFNCENCEENFEQKPAVRTTTLDGVDFAAVNELICEARRSFAASSKTSTGPALSLVPLEIKPYDPDFDLDILKEKLIKSPKSCLKPFDVVFRESKLVPVGFGISKLEIQCVVKSADAEDIIEAIMDAEADDVQSVDVDWSRCVPCAAAGNAGLLRDALLRG